MTWPSTGDRPALRTRLVGVTAVLAVAAVSAVVPVGASGAPAGSPGLPLGAADLVETRETETLTAGVTLTTIRRGTTRADRDEVSTTRQGPWRVEVLTIDRGAAQGHLRVARRTGPTRTERTTDLVRAAGALAGVNGSFFHVHTGGVVDPVGLSVDRGRLLSEPSRARAARGESGVLIDARSNRLSFGRFSWRGTVVNRRTGRVQRLDAVNRAPVVPRGCPTADRTPCGGSGHVSLLTPAYGTSTPAGPGVELVLDRAGCVVRSARARGTVLAAGQRSLQATGREAASLLRVATGGCLTGSSRLRGPDGRRVRLGPWSFALSGRHRLASGGRVLVPTGAGGFYDRNPRTVVGTTGTGRVLLVTIDGRSPTSVGTTMEETAAVVGSLGLRDAVNLDGGGSTTMSVDGHLVNRPSGRSERSVGDAVVYVDSPFR